MTDDELRELHNSEYEISDDLYRHFETLPFTDPFDVHKEGRRVWNVYFADDGDDEVEEYSAIDGIISAVAVAGYDACVRRIARCIGVNYEALIEVLYSDNVAPLSDLDLRAACATMQDKLDKEEIEK